MELRVGLVGAGLMGGHHARNLVTLPGVRLVAVADVDRGRSEALARAVGAEPAFAAEALLGRVDAVVIATPAARHAEHTRLFLEAGAHVLVEKPLATSLEDARAAFALAGARGLVLQGGQLLRYHGAVRALLDEGVVPARLEARRLVQSDRALDVSVLMDLMVHDLDLALQLIGERPVEAAAWGLGPPGREDEVEARLRFPSGAEATLLASRARPSAERSLWVEGEGTSARLNFVEPCSLRVSRPGHSEVERPFLGENPLRAQLAEFVGRVRGQPSRFSPAADLDLLDLALHLQRTLVEGPLRDKQ